MALIECWECGKQVSDRAASCIGCGAPLAHALQGWDESKQPPPAIPSAPQQQGPIIVRPAKSRGIYVLLGLFFLGMLGGHNFYAGRYGPAVGQLLCTAILGWFVIGLVITLCWVIVDLLTVTHDGNGVEMT